MGFYGVFLIVFVLFVFPPPPTALKYFPCMTFEVFGREIIGLLNRGCIKAKIIISVQISISPKYTV